ncbi:hypothetical protein RUND412_002028 [Rhizina undulata]
MSTSERHRNPPNSKSKRSPLYPHLRADCLLLLNGKLASIDRWLEEQPDWGALGEVRMEMTRLALSGAVGSEHERLRDWEKAGVGAAGEGGKGKTTPRMNRAQHVKAAETMRINLE